MTLLRTARQARFALAIKRNFDTETSAMSEHLHQRVDKVLQREVQNTCVRSTRSTKIIFKNRQDAQINFTHGVGAHMAPSTMWKNKSEFVVPQNENPYGTFCTLNTELVHGKNFAGTN